MLHFILYYPKGSRAYLVLRGKKLSNSEVIFLSNILYQQYLDSMTSSLVENVDRQRLHKCAIRLFNHNIVTCIEIRLCIPNTCIGVIIASTSHSNISFILAFYTIQFKKNLQCLSIKWQLFPLPNAQFSHLKKLVGTWKNILI
jgi:hypothetical protein